MGHLPDIYATDINVSLQIKLPLVNTAAGEPIEFWGGGEVSSVKTAWNRRSLFCPAPHNPLYCREQRQRATLLISLWESSITPPFNHSVLGLKNTWLSLYNVFCLFSSHCLWRNEFCVMIGEETLLVLKRFLDFCFVLLQQTNMSFPMEYFS